MGDPVVVVPSLSEDGWVSSINQLGDYLFSHFLLSDYSQTQLYKDQVASMAWVLHETQGDNYRCIGLLKSTLEKYFGRYFPVVNVEVKDKTSSTLPGKTVLSIYVGYTNTAGESSNLSRAIEVQDGKVSKILDYSNYGDSLYVG